MPSLSDINRKNKEKKKSSDLSAYVISKKRKLCRTEVTLAKCLPLTNRIDKFSEKKLLQEVLAEVVATSPNIASGKVSLDVESLCSATATQYNTRVLTAVPNLISPKQTPSRLITNSVVKQSLVTICETKRPRSSTSDNRKHHSKSPPPYPITLDQVQSGVLTFENARSFFRDLKSCPQLIVNKASLKGLTKTRPELCHGLRIIFQMNCLKSANLKSGVWNFEKTTTNYYFRDPATSTGLPSRNSEPKDIVLEYDKPQEVEPSSGVKD
jgi:hypothetical protein